jgi:hypothetical protein
MHSESHVSDQDLLLVADGELPLERAARVAGHLSACRSCRARKQELEFASTGVTQLLRGNLGGEFPPPARPRALLKARLAGTGSAASAARPWWHGWPEVFAWRWAAAALLFGAGIFAGYQNWMTPWISPRSTTRHAFHSVPVSFPEPSLTPGAAATFSAQQVCDSPRPNNRTVPVSLQRKVFEEYGIPGAEPRAYEVDYLITPALGGTDDIRNLWPQSNSSAVWNARVKDALEDRLHDLVCHGDLDLIAAQQDISSDWIAAYKKYFHTDRPIETAPEN